MTYIPYQRRLDLIMSSQGDTTGVTDMNKAGKTITAGTTASPVVCTATSHGYNTGDWIFIDGATGTTEINGLREVVKVDANTFSLLDEGGTAVDSAGTFGGTVDSHYAFVITPPASQVYHLTQLDGIAGDASAPLVDGMLGVARLTNGIIVAVYDQDGLTKTLTAIPVRGWHEWGLVTGGTHTDLADISNNKLEASFSWDFGVATEFHPDVHTDIRLFGDKKEKLVVYSIDDLDGLSALRIAAEGYLDYGLTAS